MGVPVFTNNASSTLASGITATATSITLAAGTGSRFPSPTGGNWFTVSLYTLVGVVESQWEIVKCTARSGDTLTVVRAQEGTTGRVWAAGTPADLRLTAAVASDLVSEVYTGIPSALATKAPLTNASLVTPGISGGTLLGTVATLTTPVIIEPAGGVLLTNTDRPNALVMRAPTAHGNTSTCYIGPLLNPTPADINDYSLVIEAVSDNVAWRNISLARSGGSVVVGSQTNIRGDGTYRLQVNGKAYLSTYTQMGPQATAPVIATKKLTGTTPSTRGGSVTLNHGLSASKILSYTVLVNGATTSDLVSPGSNAAGYEYYTLVNSAGVIVSLTATNSASILNKGIKVFLVYEE